jgi:uncharacterized membrane protein YfcA
LLTVVGRLSPHSAIPLAEVGVLCGSLAALPLNLRQAARAPSLEAPVDLHICRLVVPSALLGTLIGVLLNPSTKEGTILMLLAFVLLGVAAVIFWAAWFQREAERADELAEVFFKDAERVAGFAMPEWARRARSVSQIRESDSRWEVDRWLFGMAGRASSDDLESGGLPWLRDVGVGIATLLVVVVSGVARYHFGACRRELEQGLESHRRDACNHLVPALLTWGRLEGWMGNTLIADSVMALLLLIPIAVCFGLVAFYSYVAIREECWKPCEVVKYEAMGLLAGFLSGLVGIGGGMIYSSFFLLMGVQQAVAIATASTCVMFTSSSTALQYLFTDRVIVTFALVYGLVSFVASYAGTWLMEVLQHKLGAKRSYASGIVAVGAFFQCVAFAS